MINNKVGIIFGLLVTFGTIVSVIDYKAWKKAETEKYGQGWAGQEQVAEIAPLVGPYVNKVWRARIKYPKDWKVSENLEYSESNIYRKPLPLANKRVEIVEFTNLSQSISIKVWGEIIPNRDLVDIVTKEAIGITGDREYQNSDRARFIIIHWTSPQEVRYMAYSKNSEIVYILEGKTNPMEATLMQKTLTSMLEAFVPL